MAKDLKKRRDDATWSVQEYLDYLNTYIDYYWENKSDVYLTDIDGVETTIDCEWLYNHSSDSGLEARVAALEAKLPDLPDATPTDTPYVLTGEKDD